VNSLEFRLKKFCVPHRHEYEATLDLEKAGGASVTDIEIIGASIEFLKAHKALI
jgi:hypothetical protein